MAADPVDLRAAGGDHRDRFWAAVAAADATWLILW
jgi:hypothetical protein